MTNGISVTKTTITDGDTYSWRIDDALDSGVIMYTDNSLTPVEPFTLATINFDDGSTEKMWVAEDSVIMLSKINNRKVYQHTLKLVELTKILEKILVTGLCMTPTNKTTSEAMYGTLKNQLDTAINKINLQCHKITLISTTYDATNLIANTEPETFVFNNSTAREILDEIFSAIDSRVVVIDATLVPSNQMLYLYIDYIRMVAGNDVTLGNDTHHKLISESSSNSVEGYAGEIYSNVESAVSDNEITIQDTMKANDAIATSSNRIMSLPYAIQYPTAFKVKSNVAKISVKGTYYVAGDSSAHNITKDITTLSSGASTRDFFDALDYFVDYEYWSILSTSSQNKTLYYRRGEAEVDVSRTYKSLLVTKNVFSTMFTELLNNWYITHYAGIWDYMSAQATAAGGTLTSITKQSVTPGDIDDIVFEISYIGEIEGLATSVKSKRGFRSDLKIVDGQRTNVLDINRYGRNLEGKIARVGNDITYIDCDVDSYANILPLLTKLTDYDNGIIYQADISRHTDSETWYEVRYYLSKNYNDLNERIALKKEKRIYAIPTKGYQVIIPKRDVVSIGSGWLRGGVGTASLTSMEGCIAKALCGEGQLVSNAFIDVTIPNNTTLHFTLPATGYGSGNTINLITKFYDNASAGLSIDTDGYSGINWLGGKKVCYNKYTNEYGYAQAFSVGWGYYPNERTTAGVKAQPERLTGNVAETTTTWFTDTFTFDKDPAEAIGFQKIIQVRPYTETVVIGCFCDVNTLIKNIGDVYLYYQSTDREQYKVGDRKVKYDSTTDTRIKLSTIQINYTTEIGRTNINIVAPSLSNIDKYNIALGDEDGNMYVASNGNTSGSYLFIVT